MTKRSAFGTGVALTAVVAVFIIARDRSETERLRTALQITQAERDRLSQTTAAQPVTPTPQAQQPSPGDQEPSAEILHLRGQVGLLRRELASLQQQSAGVAQTQERTGSDTPRATDLLQPGTSLYRFSDTTLGNFSMGATTNEILTELQRIGANVLTNAEGYLMADLTNSLPLRIEFYFQDGTLQSRRDWPMAEWAASHQQ